MNRRKFLQTTGGAILAAQSAHWLRAEPPANKAPFRVLYSNDTTNLTGCVSPWHPKGAPFSRALLEASVDEVAGLVDAHFLQPGLGEVPMWPSKVLPLEEHYAWIKETYGQPPDPFGSFVLGGGDVVKVFIDRCRLRGQAAFISLRMNDAHHKELVDAKPGDKIGSLSMAITKFYHDHPEFRVGPKFGAMLQVLNWAHPEVPARKLALLTELCENYDLDGLELDFMRFYNYFPRPGTTSDQRRKIITDFVRDVRAVLDRTSQPGQRRWLGVRVPGFIKAFDPMGLDLAALAGAGVDMVNLSASYFTTQQMDTVALRQQIPKTALYVEMCHSTWNGEKLSAGYDVFPFRRTTPEQFETTAHLSYSQGADGVSLFNFAYYREHGGPGRGEFGEPPFSIVKRLGDARWLAGQPQHWFIAPGWENPFAKPAILPRKLAPGQSTDFTLPLAPPAGGWKKDGRLRVQTLEAIQDQTLTVKWNGHPLETIADIAEPYPVTFPTMLGTPETLRAWKIPSSILTTGPNRLEISLAGGSPLSLAFIDLAVS